MAIETPQFVFDFDGVLFDSASECFEVASRAILADPKGAPSLKSLLRSEPERAALEAKFLKHRFLVGPPWQYSLLFQTLGAGQEPDADRFFAEAQARKTELLGFTERYFAARRELMANETEWARHIKPVQLVCDAFAKLLAEARASILSTRDPNSIRTALKLRCNIDLPPEALLERAGDKEKWQLLCEFAESRSLPRERVVFFDDYVNHAVPARLNGFATYLCAWGYLGPADLTLAAEQDLACLSLEAFGNLMNRA